MPFKRITRRSLKDVLTSKEQSDYIRIAKNLKNATADDLELLLGIYNKYELQMNFTKQEIKEFRDHILKFTQETTRQITSLNRLIAMIK